MAKEQNPEESVTSKADALALIEQAEAEAAEAEALAAAARARARAARLKREALALAEAAEDYGDAAAAAADVDAPAHDADYDADYDAEYDNGYHAGHVKERAAEYYGATPGRAYEDYEDYGEPVADESVEEVETEPAGWRRWWRPLSAVAAILLVCAFTAASVYMALQHRSVTERQKDRAAVLAGAEQGVMAMISLDFNDARGDFQKVMESSTGTFKDDFQRHADDFISVVEQSKAVTQGTVNAAAIESTDQNSAKVLVSATSRVTNFSPGKDQPPKIWRLRVTVTDVHGHYKMSNVEYVA